MLRVEHHNKILETVNTNVKIAVAIAEYAFPESVQRLELSSSDLVVLAVVACSFPPELSLSWAAVDIGAVSVRALLVLAS